MADKVQLAKSKVKAWAAEHRQVVACDEPGSVILDVASGKGIKLNWPALREFEEKIHPETAEPYLVLLFEDGLQMALVDPGGSRSRPRPLIAVRFQVCRPWFACATTLP